MTNKKNRIEICDKYAEIRVIRNENNEIVIYKVKIDFDCVERVSKHTWWLNFYGGYIRGTSKNIYLHLFLFGKAGNGLEWDHINRDKLDNRRENLRKVNRSINQRNSLKHKLGGISFHTRYRKWQAYMYTDGRLKFLGYFTTAIEAREARARGIATLKGELDE